MALKQVQKITDKQMETYGVVAAPTVLNGTPAANKAIFDRLVRQLIAPTMNQIIDDHNDMVANEQDRISAEADREEAEAARRETVGKLVEAAEAARDAAQDAQTAAEDAKQGAEAAKTDAEAALEEIQRERLICTEEGDRAAERAEAAWDAANQAEDACGWAEDAQAAAEEAQKAAENAAKQAGEHSKVSETAAQTAAEAAGTAVKAAELATDRAEATALDAQASSQAALTATAAAGVSERVQAALHLRRRVRFGTATDAEGNLPGDTLIIIDDSTVGHSIDYADLLLEAQKAAAGEENELEAMAVLSVVNTTNLRRTADGLLWTTDTLVDFRGALTAFAAAAVAAGYVDAAGMCVATWAQVQAWFLTGELLTPIDAEAMNYPWRKVSPKTEFDALKERMNSIEAQMGQAARRMYAMTTGGPRE